MLVPPENGPQVSRRFRAMVVWLHESPLEAGQTYLVKHTARQTKIRALGIWHRVNVNTLEREQASRLNMNDIASVEFEAHVPLFFDPYDTNRSTGSFILIDAISNATVGAGMIEEAVGEAQREFASPEFAQKHVSAQERYERHGHYPATFLVPDQLALAARLERALFEQGFEVLHLNDREASAYGLLEAVRAGHAIGAVLIYSGHAPDIETRQKLAFETAAALFDLSEKNQDSDDEEFFRRALVLADSLRITKPKDHEERGS
jgi:sulfate adenylyltransferase subunit 1